ncbi:hypothetical protein ANCCAN_29625 [Ancylostoma caninum]|uniref:Secreted protein n=1 Tax=Ancylostoma caninum TaxID=29170 RepID=A0A368EXZ9_ANCCA|nr:hypothetical protein ANCCAN_29625 [Ancylostoma caninum]
MPRMLVRLVLCIGSLAHISLQETKTCYAVMRFGEPLFTVAHHWPPSSARQLVRRLLVAECGEDACRELLGKLFYLYVRGPRRYSK